MADNSKSCIQLLDEIPLDISEEYFPHKMSLKQIENIIENNSDITKKTILLNGDWGSGKTTILKVLKDKLKEKYQFIDFDAWNAPANMLKKEFLRELYRQTSLDKEKKGKPSTKYKEIDTVNHERQVNIPKPTILVYILITLLITVVPPLIAIGQIKLPSISEYFSIFFNLANINSVANSLIYIIITLILLFPIFFIFCSKFRKKTSKILLPFLNGEFDVYSEYREDADLTPYNFKEKLKDFFEVYKCENKQELIITIDNLDRLSPEDQRGYIDALYTFMDSSKQITKNEVKVWFIIAFSKECLSENGNIKNSFFDKISPYEVALPPLNTDITNLFLKSLLKKQYGDSDYKISSLKDENFNHIVDIYNFFANAKFPSWVDDKEDNSNCDVKYNTPRMVKKFVNQFEIIIKSSKLELTHSDSLNNDLGLFIAAAFVAASKTLYCEKQLKSIIQKKDKIPPTYVQVSHPHNTPTEKEKEDKVIGGELRDLIKGGFYGYDNIDYVSNIVSAIIYNIKPPTKKELLDYIGNTEYESKIKLCFIRFHSNDLRENLQAAMKNYLSEKKEDVLYIIEKNKKINEISKEFKPLFIDTDIANTLLEMLKEKEDVFYYHLHSILYIYTYSSKTGEQKEQIKNILKTSIEKTDYKAKIIYNCIEVLEKRYSNENEHFTDNGLFKHYDFIKEIVANNFKDMTCGYSPEDDGMSYPVYFKLHGLSSLHQVDEKTREKIFSWAGKDDVAPLICELSKGMNTTDNSYFSINSELWHWALLDIYRYESYKYDLPEFTALLNEAIKNIKHSYIAYFIDLDYSFKEGYNLIKEKPELLNKNIIDIILSMINKFKDNDQYKEEIKEITEKILSFISNYRGALEKFNAMSIDSSSWLYKTVEEYYKNDIINCEYMKYLADEAKKNNLYLPDEYLVFDQQNTFNHEGKG